jgi:hypothetical protein
MSVRMYGKYFSARENSFLNSVNLHATAEGSKTCRGLTIYTALGLVQDYLGRDVLGEISIQRVLTWQTAKCNNRSG